MRALRIFPCDTTAVERRSSGEQGLAGHYHSPPVTLISWWASSLSSPSFPVPFSVSTYPCLHQFALTAWFCLSGEQARTETGRQPETQRDRGKAKDDENKMETDRNGQKDAGGKRRRKRGIILISHLKAFVIIAPLAMLVIAKCLWSANTLWKYVTVYMLLILFLVLIPLS